MQQPSRQWPWHGLAVLILVGLCAGLYFATKRIDYNWRWQNIPQYLINTEGADITAPFDGYVHLSADHKTLSLSELKGTRTAQFSGYKDTLVDDGDLVFTGDVLAHSPHMGLGQLAAGLLLTLELSIVSLLVSLVLGLLAGLARVSRNPTIADLAAVYVEVIRGTPLLVQIFIVYFFIGTVLQLTAFAAGVVALSVFTAAYVAEIVRAGIQAVPKGQTEAAQSLGMSGFQTMLHVILPQALRRILPPLAGQSINLIKDSSLVSVMALTDLTKAGREVVSSTFSPFEVWFTVAVMYLALTGALSWGVQILEKRLRAHD